MCHGAIVGLVNHLWEPSRFERWYINLKADLQHSYTQRKPLLGLSLQYASAILSGIWREMYFIMLRCFAPYLIKEVSVTFILVIYLSGLGDVSLMRTSKLLLEFNSTKTCVQQDIQYPVQSSIKFYCGKTLVSISLFKFVLFQKYTRILIRSDI